MRGRATKPSSASEAITRVIDGGRTRSRTANAPGVIAPSLASVDSADNCDSETGESGTAKPQLASQPHDRQRQVARQPSIGVLHKAKNSERMFLRVQNTTGFRSAAIAS